MSIKKRGNVWYIRFVTPEGEEVRVSSGTADRQTAQELHDDLRSRAWRDAKLGEKTTKTWEDACLQWFEDKGDKASIEDDRSKARWLNQHLSGMFLNTIDEAMIAKLIKLKLEEAGKTTVNRHMQFLRSVLRRAETTWKWLDKAPKFELFPEEKTHVRWITPEQARLLLSELPSHLKSAATLALSTGQRQANILQMEWSQLDLKRCTYTLQAHQTKNKKPLVVPLNSSALAIINSLVGQHPTHVITYNGVPIKQASTRAWYKALKRAGIVKFRWHDLRHTWASWLVQNGTPLIALQEMGGWESASMVKKYAHLDVTHLQVHADNLPSL